ncbi:hypothetical protein [Kitasatospora aureofaciens]|uniref:hypothetical protein n=1 Tax=Kitasatospora aureofaciens TaxID=1894 RepID=UPI001C458109|nr:hypothetical protein [Kitasatospora aureofaciens]
MPASARWLAGVAVAVFLLPLAVMVGTFGVAWPYFQDLVGLVCPAACAVPVFYRERNPFRVACAAAGAVVAAVWVPLALIAIWPVLALGCWSWFLLCLFLPIAAITALIAAFQRARGAECGRVAAALGWAVGALSVICWVYVTLC